MDGSSRSCGSSTAAWARSRSIRSRLVLLVAACVLPAALLVFALIAYGYGQARDDLARNVLATSRALMNTVDHDLGEIEADLGALAASPDLARGDLDALEVHAINILRAHRLEAILLLDADLRSRMATSPALTVASREIEAAVRRVRETRTSAITGPVEHGPARAPEVIVAVPVVRGDAVPYVLCARVAASRLFDILAEQRLPADWIGVIFDADGTIVARTHEADRFVGRKPVQALLEGSRQNGSGAVETTTLEGIRVLSVFSTSPASHWTVALGIPLAQLEAPLQRAVAWLIGGTVVLLACTVLLAWVIADRIATSIQHLVEPARRLGRGERVRVATLDIREANDVALALEEAATMLANAQHRANHDPLTALANRALFSELLSHRLGIAERARTPLVLALIDLDGFKRINDGYGHMVGDEVLRLAANRLVHAVRDSDAAARLGGDEFAVVLSGVDLRAAMPVCEQLLDALSMPYVVDGVRLELSASIGVGAYPDTATTAEALLRRTDEALYAAKRAGKHRYAVAERHAGSA